MNNENGKEIIEKRIKEIKNDKVKKLLISFIRFMLRYGIPAILMILGIVGAIFLPKKYYYEGQIFNIKNAVFSIGIFFIVLETVALTLSYYLIQWCIKNKITKH